MSTTLNASSPRSKTTVQRANYRISITSTSAGSPVGSSAAAQLSAAKRLSAATSTNSSPASNQLPSSPWDVQEDTVCDTWSGYLTSQHAKSVDRSSGASRDGATAKTRGGCQQHPHSLKPMAPHTAYMPLGNLLNTLSACIAKQNEAWEQLQVQTISERRAEEVKRQQQIKAAGTAGLENTLTATVMQRLLNNAQERWQELLTARIDSAVARDAKETEKKKTLPKKGERPASGSDQDAAEAADPSSASPLPSLPSVGELYDVLVAGLNDRSTRQYVIEELGVEVDNSGIDSTGLITQFEPHIQALAHWFPNMAPDLKTLRTCFRELDPRYLSATAVKVEALGTSLNAAEVQLDLLLRDGDSAEAAAALLRQSVHSAMRRLVYPRAFRIPLRVTDGKPPFPAEKDFAVNDTSSQTIPSYLTCASKYGRDKVRRRTQHSFSTALQDARAQALQRMAVRDVLINVGDSDKYFVYQDDCDVLHSALVADRGVPVNGLKAALEQMGRCDDALDGYVVYLRSQDGDIIQQKAPPCGFFPLAGSSLLIAPVANMTGDTVEQYEIASAMFGQLWGRLQGPTPELLQCCFIFEKLITDRALPATLHATRVLQTPPLRLALEWMLTGFAEALDPYEVLILWDWISACHVKEMHGRSPLSQPVGLARVNSTAAHETGASNSHRRGSLAHDETGTAPCALWLLSVMAAGLFVFRAPLVLKCRTRLDLQALFVANHHVSCRTLLQAFLFTDAFTG